MRYELQLAQLSDDALLLGLHSILRDSRRTEGDLVAHIGEVDARHLYAREALPSMYVYCMKVLHLSEAEAYLRIAAARAARSYPAVLEMLIDGRLHLAAISRLAPHLTSENHADLLARATHKTRREVEELVAELAPQPDAPAVVRKLPSKPAPEAPRLGLEPGASASVLELCPDRVGSSAPSELCPDRVGSSAPSGPPARIEVLAPARYKIQFTASADLCDKLERLKVLMRSKFPDGDLARVFEELVTERLERLEARRFAKTRRPRANTVPRDDGSRYLSAALRRAVSLRDGSQCRFTDARGRRCPEQRGLEYHHQDPYARGGARSVNNIVLMCRMHNQYLAERDYGRARIQRHRDRPRSGALGLNNRPT